MTANTVSMKLLLIPFFFLLLCSFTPPKKKKYRSIRKEDIPGVVRIDSRLYMDEAEVTNFNWLEYRYWLRRMYGEESIRYRQEQPDTLVWNEERGDPTEPTAVFYNHPVYRDYPIVGLTYEQMERYCSWRSDRVFENMLLATGRIEWSPETDSSDCFTIERYMSGQYRDYMPDSSITEVPYYHLPTREEWEKAAAYAERIYSGLSPRQRRKGPDAYYSSLPTVDLTHPVFPDRKHSVRGAIYNLHRNVSEQLSDSTQMAGGNWKNKNILAEDENYQPTFLPSIVKGFRCAFEWRPMLVHIVPLPEEEDIEF